VLSEVELNVLILFASRAGRVTGYGLDGRVSILGRSKIYFSSP
jgi:hypothetical protein